MNEDFYLTRIKICEECRLYKISFSGAICNPDLYLNLEDKTTTSYIPKNGYVRGCNCLLKRKAKIKNAKCIAGKW